MKNSILVKYFGGGLLLALSAALTAQAEQGAGWATLGIAILIGTVSIALLWSVWREL